MCELHLGIGQDLLLKITDLALFVARGAFDRAKIAIVLVTRPDGHIVETAVRDASDTHFYGTCGHIQLSLACIVATLADNALCGSLMRIQSAALLH